MTQTPELWVSHTGTVHARRERWYVGTQDERWADPEGPPIMLCGVRRQIELAPAETTEITCGTCRMARARTKIKEDA